MSITAKPLAQAKWITDSDTTLYTPPSGTKTILDKMTLTNTDTNNITVSIHVRPANAAVSDQVMLVKAKSITAGATVEITEIKNHVIQTTDTISAIASTTNKVSAYISGREVT